MKKYINKEENKHLKFNVGEISIARNSNETTRINTKTNIGKRLISTKGITLISLVITIILLILLAGVAINLSVGENGIFNKVKQAKEQYTESIAKEKLEMVLLDVIAEKGTNSEYNNRQFLDDMLKANGIEVQGDNVIIDNYIFTLDRDSLGITQSLGQTQIKVTKEVQKYLGKNANDKYEAQLLIIVESNTNLQKVEITNPDGTKLELETDKEKIAKDITVEFDEEYKLEITDKTGKKETRIIVERTEEYIRTPQELAELRNKININADRITYEGKIIKLLRDIDLSTVCGKDVNGEEISWEPIECFKGSFEGNNHTISNLYINSTVNSPVYSYNAMFRVTIDAYIGNVTLKGGEIKSNRISAGLVGYAHSTTIVNVKNGINVEMNSDENVGGIAGVVIDESIVSKCVNIGTIKGKYAGGICGQIYNGSYVEQCCNYGDITSNSGFAGGIGALTNSAKGYDTKVENCYNCGKIYGSKQTGGILGGLGRGGTHTVKNCYNVGEISGSNKYAIVGAYDTWDGTPTRHYENNYWLSGCGTTSGIYGNTSAVKLSSEQMKTATFANILNKTQTYSSAMDFTTSYIENENNYWVENTKKENSNQDEANVYSNNGYPIFKWQL